MFENHRKSLIQHYILSGQKLIKNAKKWCILASFWKPEACGQTVLPDRSVLIRHKLVGNGKVQKFKCDIFSNFQTCRTVRDSLSRSKSKLTLCFYIVQSSPDLVIVKLVKVPGLVRNYYWTFQNCSKITVNSKGGLRRGGRSLRLL